jgi:Glycosyl transferase family 2
MSESIPGDPVLSDESDPTLFGDVQSVVILPTLDEVEGLARTLRDLPFDQFDEPGHRVQPLIIDGGSTDGTLDVAREWDIPVLSQTSRGKGGAMLESVGWVHRMGVPFAVVLDADATYPTDRILPTLDLLRGGTDLVIGVRRPGWGPPSDLTDLIHRVGNLVLSSSASLLAGRPILDLCSGFWGVSTERFMELGLEDASFAIEAELVLKSIRRGFSIHQIPVVYHERVGVAKLRAVRDGSRIIRTILQQARPNRDPAEKRSAPAPWERELLSIKRTLGGYRAVLECDPSEAAEGQRIARALQRSFPTTEGRTGPVSSTPVSVDSMAGGTRGPGPDDGANSRSPVEGTLLSAGSDLGIARSVNVSYSEHRRQLTIEPPSDSEYLRTDTSAPVWSQSGAWRASVRPHRERFPSLLVVASRLNFQPKHQHQTLLAANGVKVTEGIPDQGGPSVAPVAAAARPPSRRNKLGFRRRPPG